MSKKKKTLLFILLGVLLCIIGFITIKNEVLASGIIGEDNAGEHLFNKYPIENYRPDTYIDTSGNWIPWNWGKAAGDGAYSLLNYLVGSMYIAIFNFFYIIGFLVQTVYSADVVEPLMEMVVNFIQNVSGFNGGFLQNGLFTQLLKIVVMLAGVYYAVLLLKRETGRTIGGFAAFCLLVVVSLGFFWKAETFIGGMNNIANSIQAVVVKAGTNALGMDADPAVAVREGFFDVTVFKPYLLLQYDDTSISKEKADKILSLDSGSEEREELVKKEVEENENRMMNGTTGLDLRISNLLPLLLSSVVLSAVIMIMVGMNVYHQLVFLIYCCLSPFILIVSLLPGKAQIAVRLGSKIVYELCMRIGLALLLCLMYGFSNVVYMIAGSGGYMAGAILQSIVYIVIFLFRKKIYALFITDGKPTKSKGLRNMIATAYLANKGMKMFQGVSGNRPVSRPRHRQQSNGGAGLATVSDGGIQRSTSRDSTSADSVGSLVPRKDSSVESMSAGNKQKKMSDKQIGTAKQQGRNRRYRTVAPVKSPSAQFSNFGSSRYRRNSSAVRTTPGMTRRSSGHLMRDKKYQVATRANVPRIKSSEWKHENPLQSRDMNKGSLAMVAGSETISQAKRGDVRKDNQLQSRDIKKGGNPDMRQKNESYKAAKRENVPSVKGNRISPANGKSYHSRQNINQRNKSK